MRILPSLIAIGGLMFAGCGRKELSGADVAQERGPAVAAVPAPVRPPAPLTPRWSRRFEAGTREPLGQQLAVAGGTIYVVASFERSMASEGRTVRSAGNLDLMVATLDGDGGVKAMWSMGGPDADSAGSLIGLRDGALLAGSTSSTIEIAGTRIGAPAAAGRSILEQSDHQFLAWLGPDRPRRAAALFAGVPHLLGVELVAVGQGETLALGIRMRDGYATAVQRIGRDGHPNGEQTIAGAVLRPLGVTGAGVVVGAARERDDGAALLTTPASSATPPALTDLIRVRDAAPGAWVELGGRGLFFGSAQRYQLDERPPAATRVHMSMYGFGRELDGGLAWDRPGMIEAVSVVVAALPRNADEAVVAVHVLHAGSRTADGRTDEVGPGAVLLRIDRAGRERGLHPIPALRSLSAASMLGRDRLVLVGSCANQKPSTADRDRLEERLDLHFYPAMCLIAVDLPS
jgi:hypothetical protein